MKLKIIKDWGTHKKGDILDNSSPATMQALVGLYGVAEVVKEKEVGIIEEEIAKEEKKILKKDKKKKDIKKIKITDVSLEKESDVGGGEVVEIIESKEEDKEMKEEELEEEAKIDKEADEEVKDEKETEEDAPPPEEKETASEKVSKKSKK